MELMLSLHHPRPLRSILIPHDAHRGEDVNRAHHPAPGTRTHKIRCNVDPSLREADGPHAEPRKCGYSPSSLVAAVDARFASRVGSDLLCRPISPLRSDAGRVIQLSFTDVPNLRHWPGHVASVETFRVEPATVKSQGVGSACGPEWL